MMRVQGGEWRGRELARPKSAAVRPISAMTLQALFNILGPVSGKRFLDAYAGSGAIGFEALSRGADFAEAVEMLPAAIAAIRQNAEVLGAGERHHLSAMAVERWLEGPGRFDAIVAGPPFAKLDEAVLEKLTEHLESGGTMVVWHSSRLSPPKLKSVELAQSRTYGDSALSFYN